MITKPLSYYSTVHFYEVPALYDVSIAYCIMAGTGLTSKLEESAFKLVRSGECVYVKIDRGYPYFPDRTGIDRFNIGYSIGKDDNDY